MHPAEVGHLGETVVEVAGQDGDVGPTERTGDLRVVAGLDHFGPSKLIALFGQVGIGPGEGDQRVLDVWHQPSLSLSLRDIRGSSTVRRPSPRNSAPRR
jgi:hypothetical protein